MTVEASRRSSRLPLLAAVDVCVIGGGSAGSTSAGSTAAIAAARAGAPVLDEAPTVEAVANRR